ncbi:MAG: large conductance mechanosensitive channel protein MscL [Clostridia bacterium]
MRKFFKEFRAFITKGNVFDMAVGLIIATAFNKIVSSMVNDILMPLVTYFTGASSMADLSIPLRIVDGEVTLSFAYGAFLQTVIDFLIIAFSVFIMVKFMMNSQKKFRELKVVMKEESTEEARKKRKELRAKAKAENRPFKEVYKEYKADQKRQAEETKAKKAEEERLKAEAEKLANPSQEMLLKQIRDLLMEMKEGKPVENVDVKKAQEVLENTGLTIENNDNK